MADFEWYRSFVAIYRLGTVSKAAEARHMTQPALSQHLAALEAQVGAPLFIRQPRRMVPTERGVELYSRVAPAIDRLERTTSELRGIPDTPVRLGAPLEYFKERLAPLFAGDTGRMSVVFGKTADLVDSLEDHGVDVVVATQHLARSGLRFVRLDTEEFWLIASPNKSIAADPADVDAVRSELEQQAWISYGEDLPIIRRFWMESFGERPAVTPRMVVPDLHAICGLVQREAGVSVLPSYLVRQHVDAGRLKVLWSPPRRVQNEIWVAYRTRDHNNAPVRRLVQRLLFGAGDEFTPSPY